MSDNYKIAITCVVDGEGNLLMIRRVMDHGDENSLKWEFPSGHVDGGERPEIAAVRETFEETGLKVYLMPWSIDIPTKAGKAAQFVGFVYNGDIKPEPTLAEDEHDKYIWVKPENLSKVKPTHKKMEEHLGKLLKKIKHGLTHGPLTKENSQRVVSHDVTITNQREFGAMKDRDGHILFDAFNNGKLSKRQANQFLQTRLVRQLPGPGSDLRDAILVGDEVEIFLKEQAFRGENPDPDISGFVDRRNKDTLWVRPLAEGDDNPENLGRALKWKNDDDWAFIRVYRDPDQVIHYVKGNPYDPDKKTMERAKGLGLILESEAPTNYESVWALMRGETPDLDRSMGQAPQTFSEVAPFNEPRPGIPPILHRVREVLRDSGLEPDMVDHLGNGRVLILTSDPDLKKDIVRVLQQGGTEVKAGRRGGLIVTQGRRRQAVGGTTTVPIQTDEKLMNMTLLQHRDKLRRERKRQLKRERQAADVLGQATTGQPVTNPSQAFTPNPSITIENPMTQVKGLQKYGKTEVLPADQGIKMTFEDDNKMQQFQNDMKNNPMFKFTQTASRREKRTAAREFIRGFRMAMRQGDYGSASEFLSRLVGMKVGEDAIIRSKLASRMEWAELSHYATGMGEAGISRLSRRASRSAPLL